MPHTAAGLDSSNAARVVDILAGLASAGVTVIITIHQPRPDVFNLMQRVLILSGNGRLVYSGKPLLQYTVMQTVPTHFGHKEHGSQIVVLHESTSLKKRSFMFHTNADAIPAARDQSHATDRQYATIAHPAIESASTGTATLVAKHSQHSSSSSSLYAVMSFLFAVATIGVSISVKACGAASFLLADEQSKQKRLKLLWMLASIFA